MADSTIYITIDATAAIKAAERVRKALDQIADAVNEMTVGTETHDPAQLSFHADSFRITDNEVDFKDISVAELNVRSLLNSKPASTSEGLGTTRGVNS